MAKKLIKDWPAYRYGPDGQARIFHRKEDVPTGWKDHPTPAKDSLPVDDLNKPSTAAADLHKISELETEVARLKAEIEELRSRADRDSEIERARQMDPGMDIPPMPDISPATSTQPVKPVGEVDTPKADTPKADTPKADTPKEPSKVRKLDGAAKGKSKGKEDPKPFTPQDDSITLDESRKEALSVLRANGVEIDDNATDGEIEKALNSLTED